jgi:hypothetical protein
VQARLATVLDRRWLGRASGAAERANGPLAAVGPLMAHLLFPLGTEIVVVVAGFKSQDR